MKHIAFSTLFLLGAGAPILAAERPNIVLVMADDQGWGDMAYNGHPVLQTPNFDAAAAGGLRFDRFYAAAPVCSPTRASVMTGRHPNRMAVFKWGHPIRPQEVTIAEELRQAGYVTGHFGKWHLGSVRPDSPVHPGRNGFDEWLSAPNFFDNDPILCHLGSAVQMRGESSEVTVDAAIEWISQVSRHERPFLAVVWFGSPHSPHRAAERDRALYSGLEKARQNFYGEISGMDRAFGKLRDMLWKSDLRSQTLLWYCSDNGALPRVGSTGGHRGAKGAVYEGGLLVPAILEWPAVIDSPRITRMRANTSDIFPTLLEVAGVPYTRERPLDGISLVSLIRRESEERHSGMGFWNHPTAGIPTPSAQFMAELLAAQESGKQLPPYDASRHAAELPASPYPTDRFPGHAAWISGNWKLHRMERDEQVQWELYDLERDPAEEHDVAASEPDQVNRLQEQLEGWLASVARSLNGEDY